MALQERECRDMAERLDEWQREAASLERVTAREVDSHLISGTSQRYETTWLRDRVGRQVRFLALRLQELQ